MIPCVPPASPNLHFLAPGSPDRCSPRWMSIAAFNEISFTTASPPRSGRFIVEPTVGVAGQTIFRFGLENWEDDGLSPVTYELRYRDPLTNGTVPLVSRTATNEFFSVLPPVTLAKQGYELNILAFIIDKVNAKAVVETTVILREPDLSHSSDMTLCLEETTPLDLDGCGESDTRLRVICENANCSVPRLPLQCRSSSRGVHRSRADDVGGASPIREEAGELRPRSPLIGSP